jgi:hypothetical protein
VKKSPLIKRSISALVATTIITVPFFSSPVSAYYGHAEITPAVTNLTTKSWVSGQAGTGYRISY